MKQKYNPKPFTFYSFLFSREKGLFSFHFPLSPSNSERSRGQVLIEAIVAITLITVGLLGVYTFISRSYSLNRVVADQYIGTYLAAEGIEVAKNLIDAGASPVSGDYELEYDSSDFGSPVSVELSPLYFDTTTGYYSYKSGGQKTRFTRKITIGPGAGADETKVVSRVDWLSQGGGQFNVVLEDNFYKWPTE